MTDVAVRPISPDQHEVVMHYFDMVAYADNPNWSRCYCMERLREDYASSTKPENRERRSELILSAKANGLVAYRLGRVVGWCHAAPKTELANIEGVRDPTVGAIVCFVVAPDQRRQGVATTLLEAALDHLKTRGMKAVEAYPVLGEIDPTRWSQVNYMGPLAMYVKAGFEIVQKNDDRAVVRRTL